MAQPKYGHNPELSASDIARRLELVSQPDYSSMDLFWTSQPKWPFSPRTVSSGSSSRTKPRKIHLAVFDSSFDPPTRAHFEIALSRYPAQLPESDGQESASPISTRRATRSNLEGVNDDGETGVSHPGPYTAILLLLSARNVDKNPAQSGSSSGPRQSTFAERIEMMIEQAKAMDVELNPGKQYRNGSSGGMQEAFGRQEQEGHGGIAVAALNFPTFVGKSVIVHKWLQSHLSMTEQNSVHADTTLSFLLGSDTLTRLFLPKYYPPSSTFPEIGPDMDAQLEYFFERDHSKMVVVRRYVSSEDRDKEQAFVNDDPRCRKWVEHGGLRFVDEDGGDQGVRRGEEMGEISSSVVRKTVGEKGYGGVGNELCVKGVREYMQGKGLYS